MKIILICFLVLSSDKLFGQNVTNYEKVSIPDTKWNTKSILVELFENSFIDSSSAVKWKSFSGEVNEKSFDGFCYTTIDSIYSFKNESFNYRIVVLKTSSYSDENLDGLSNAEASTFGIALFSKVNENWNLLNFNRSAMLTGRAGDLGYIEILDLGNNLLLLSLSESEHQDIDLHNFLFSLNNSNFGLNVFSTRTFHRIVETNEDTYKYEFSEFDISKATTEDSFPKMVLTKKCTIVTQDLESTEILSTSILEFDGSGFY
jgi:hypothetical protein